MPTKRVPANELPENEVPANHANWREWGGDRAWSAEGDGSAKGAGSGRRGLATVLVGMVAAAVGGCFGQGPDAPIEVQGRMLLDGKPLESPGVNGELRIELWRMTDGSGPVDPETVTYNFADGSLYVSGAEEDGIQAGKYKMVVMQLKDYADEGSDVFGGALSKEKTSIVCEVTPDSGRLEIELSEYVKH